MNNHPIHFFDFKGNSVKVGRQLGRGGEGAVFDALSEPDYVAKIYHETIPSDKAEKIQGMATNFSTKLLEFAAWPIKALYKDPNRSDLCGFLMPKVLGFHEIHVLYSPAQRKKVFPKVSWAFLIRAARNLASAISTIHEHGHVIGDVNQKNFLVSSQALIKVIDCDSFQVRFSGKSFPCEVGVSHFLPPELQNKSLAGIERFQDHDNFGLALLIFHLLFMGRHPFVGVSKSGDYSIEQAISEYRFAYGSLARNIGLNQPPNTLPLKTVSSPVAELFEQAFSADYRKKGRPTAKVWVEALETLESELRSCQQPNHKFHRSSPFCPWCDLEKSGIHCFVGLVNAQNLSINLQNLDSVCAEIKTLVEIEIGPFPNVQILPIVFPNIPFPSVAATPIPEKARIGANPGIVRISLQYIILYGGCISGFVFPPIWLLVFLAMVLDEPLGLYLMAGPGELNQEKNRRENLVNTIERELESVKEECKKHNLNLALENIRREWHRASAVESPFKRAKEELRTVYRAYSSLNGDIAKEIQEARQASALIEYLDHHYIHDAIISNIGTQRKATLASFGIETAADLSREKILNIPGFGPSLTADLLAWRQIIENKFRRNPPTNLPDLDQTKATQIQQRFLNKKNELEAKLRNGPKQLERLNSESILRRNALQSKINDILKERSDFSQSISKKAIDIISRLAQAKADLELVNKMTPPT